jgi:hypothetical protein
VESELTADGHARKLTVSDAAERNQMGVGCAFAHERDSVDKPGLGTTSNVMNRCPARRAVFLKCAVRAEADAPVHGEERQIYVRRPFWISQYISCLQI